MLDEFSSTLDCADVTFIPNGFLDELHQQSTIGRTRVGGIDINRTRARTAMRAVVALSAKPDGFSAADLVAKVHTTIGDTNYTVRQAAYDLPKLRGHHLILKPGRGRRYHVPADAAVPCAPCSPCATTSSRRSSPGSGHPDQAGHQRPSPSSTATTNIYAPR